MQYVTVEGLSRIIRDNLYRIPRDIDLVVGIPRSGMLAAELVALYLNLRLTDLDSFLEGKIYSVGETRNYTISSKQIRHVLVVDDSIYSGASLNHAREKIGSLSEKYHLTFMAVIATTEGSRQVDIFGTIIDGERVFEWNLFHHWFITKACLDLDGILCEDPVEDDDGEVYRQFLLNAKPRFLPTQEINTIITCRLEKYRSLTEQWLHKYGVKYQKLIMLNMDSRDERRKWGKHGEWKGHYYKNSDCFLFIESDCRQAQRIASVSGKHVIDMQTNTMLFIQPSGSKPNSKRIWIRGIRYLNNKILRPIYNTFFNR